MPRERKVRKPKKSGEKRERGERGTVLEPVYNTSMCEKVMRVGLEGGSHAKMANACGVTRNTMYEWCKSRPEFKFAFTMANQAAQEYWEDEGKRHIKHLNYKSPMWAYFMRRFGADYQEVSTQRHIGGGADDPPIVTRIERVIVRPEKKKA